MFMMFTLNRLNADGLLQRVSGHCRARDFQSLRSHESTSMATYLASRLRSLTNDNGCARRDDHFEKFCFRERSEGPVPAE
jgi:hypothetical protein